MIKIAFEIYISIKFLAKMIKKSAANPCFIEKKKISFLTCSIPFRRLKIFLCIVSFCTAVHSDMGAVVRPPLPVLPINFGTFGALSLSQGAMDYRFSNDRFLVSANLGWGYTASGGTGLAGIDVGFLVNDRSALGLNLAYQRDKFEAVLHGLRYWLPLGLRFKGSLDYMQGRQEFSFLRSSAKARLSQLTYYGALDWLESSNFALGLQNLGASTWGGKAKNHSQFETQTYIDDTPDYFVISRDPQLLSAGRLTGVAFNFQSLYSNWTIKGSLGKEWLKFPFSDGNVEKKRSNYFDARVGYQFNVGDTINLRYKFGAVENRIELAWQRANLSISAFHSQGKNGIEDQHGIKLTVDLLALPNAKKSVTNNLLALNIQPSGMEGGKLNRVELLQEVISRPAQLPSAFMVKVDPTGVRRIRIEKATLPEKSVITPQGNVLIPVGSNTVTIVFAKVNGLPVTSSGEKFGTQGNQLVVYSPNLPPPSNTDSYAVGLEDGTGASYIVTFDAINS